MVRVWARLGVEEAGRAGVAAGLALGVAAGAAAGEAAHHVIAEGAEREVWSDW